AKVPAASAIHSGAMVALVALKATVSDGSLPLAAGLGLALALALAAGFPAGLPLAAGLALVPALAAGLAAAAELLAAGLAAVAELVLAPAAAGLLAGAADPPQAASRTAPAASVEARRRSVLSWSIAGHDTAARRRSG